MTDPSPSPSPADPPPADPASPPAAAPAPTDPPAPAPTEAVPGPAATWPDGPAPAPTAVSDDPASAGAGSVPGFSPWAGPHQTPTAGHGPAGHGPAPWGDPAVTAYPGQAYPGQAYPGHAYPGQPGTPAGYYVDPASGQVFVAQGYAYPPQPGYGPPAYGYGYGYGQPPRPPLDGLALASMIVSCAGVLGLFSYGIGGLLGLVGAILGHVARGRIRRSGKEGNSFALAGIIVGWALTAICAAIVAFIIVVVVNEPDF